jgi:hypothetical protein
MEPHKFARAFARKRMYKYLGDFDFLAVSVVVDLHDIHVLIGVVRWLRVATFVLTG